MDLTDKIINNRDYKSCMEKIEAFEKDRIFCKHDADHAFAVARIAYCLNLERGYGISKDTIYCAALLHDIGRCRQYETGQPHDEAGVELSRDILEACKASGALKEEILEVISSHRGECRKEGSPLAEIIREADNLSRSCFNCKASRECNWSQDRRNMTLKY